jgi:phosphinothricin acetyltransferase
MTITIRLANTEDAQAIQAIYAPIVQNTVISFELEVPGVEEMRSRIQNITRQYPWLVLEKDQEILGYVYASPHRTRMAYQWSVDVTAYVHEKARRMGVGRTLYVSMFEILKLQGYYNAFAGIALPNDGSVGLHEAMGFTPVGVYRSVGYKLGAWHDVGWWQLRLQDDNQTPISPKSLNDVPYKEVIQSGLSMFSE